MRILHVFRKPMGGLFRHVRDLATEQSKLGHSVGIICDINAAPDAETMLGELARICNLGVLRLAIGNLPGVADIAALRAVAAKARAVGAEVLHGHGAKGGLYARLVAPGAGMKGIYTPHGGSLHYEWLRPPGTLFLTAERVLRRPRTGLVFVCQFERQLFDHKIGIGRIANTVVYNGITEGEFTLRKLKPEATDLLFVGEMRALKGVDILLHAIALMPNGKRPSLTLVGDGPELESYKKLGKDLRLQDLLTWAGRLPINQALTMGQLLVVPSRHESFPYVVLEAVAAGAPVIASKIGGISEALPPTCLFPAGNTLALSAMITDKINDLSATERGALALRGDAKGRFTTSKMAQDISAFYTRV